MFIVSDNIIVFLEINIILLFKELINALDKCRKNDYIMMKGLTMFYNEVF